MHSFANFKATIAKIPHGYRCDQRNAALLVWCTISCGRRGHQELAPGDGLGKNKHVSQESEHDKEIILPVQRRGHLIILFLPVFSFLCFLSFNRKSSTSYLVMEELPQRRTETVLSERRVPFSIFFVCLPSCPEIAEQQLPSSFMTISSPLSRVQTAPF